MIDLLVIGSGYGGSVVAARLAPHARVVIVERGRWWRPGDFPEGLAPLIGAYRSRRNPGGLWSMRLGHGTGVAFASAVGGSSPINYGITARPDDHVFASWPGAAAAMAPWFDKAREVLRPEPNPLGDLLGDKRFLDRVEPGRRVDLENTIDWGQCDQCGHCVSGCNAGAKRSLDRSYLALAIAAGADLQSCTEARSLVPLDGGGYAVELRTTGGGQPEWVRARSVVIAAGTMGTLDLIRRSGLDVGSMFGQRMSLNGDGVAFLCDTPHRLSGHTGSPISTSVRIPFVDEAGLERTLMVMSGRVPQAARRVAAAALMMISGGRRRRWLRDLVRPGPRGPLSRSFMYKLDAEDSARGTARFTPRGVVIDWPRYVDEPIVRFAEERLRRWAETTGGRVTASATRLTGRGLSVHPLGGCRMGASIEDGVVDGVGRVFDPRGGVHGGLRIADGSIVPTALGVPPSWTIAALGERIAADLVREREVNALAAVPLTT